MCKCIMQALWPGVDLAERLLQTLSARPLYLMYIRIMQALWLGVEPADLLLQTLSASPKSCIFA